MIRAEALGEPGSRRFRIVAVILGETYILWMEKQQVQALGLAIEQLVEHLPMPGPGATPESAVYDEGTTNQFRVGRIEIAFDEAVSQIVVAAHDIEQEEGEESPTLAIRITRLQANDVARQAADLMTQGRPLCPMCGQPMDAGIHVCPEQNGHLPLTFDDELF